MRLNLRVVAHHLADEFTDGQARVSVRCLEADSIDSTLRFSVNDLAKYPLGSVLVLALTQVVVPGKGGAPS